MMYASVSPFFRFFVFLQARVLSDNQDNMIDNHNNNFLLIGARPFRPFRSRVHVLSDNRDNMIDNHNNIFY